MIVMQGGIVEFVAFVVVMALVVLGIGYFLVLPGIVFWKATKAWKERSRIILFARFFGLLFSLGAYFFTVPRYNPASYYLQAHPEAIPHVMIDQFLRLMFWWIPLIFIGVTCLIWLVNFLQSRSYVVTVEGCVQPSGCKMRDKGHH